MKALTVWQPWASLIVAGAKPYEFRGWRAPGKLVGQRIVIHAAARPIHADEVGDLISRLALRDQDEASRIRAAETCLDPGPALAVLNRALQGDLPLSAGVGTAVLGEATYALGIAVDFGLDRANDSDRNDDANWGWPMSDVEQWATPVPARGRQGFWVWPTAEETLLMAEAAHG